MKRNYFKNSQKFAICEIRKIPNENTTFFPGKLYQEVFCFTLLLRLWYSIPRLVWFGQLLDPMKKTFFYISFFAKFKKFRMKYLIFSGKGIQNFFCFTLSLHSWYCTPSLVWFGQLPVPIKKNYFLNSQKFALREIRKIPYENPIFFPRQAIPNTLFAVHSHYTGDTQYRVWFDLDSSLKVPYENPTFFLGKLNQKKLFALHCNYTGDTQYRVWFDLDNSLTRWKRIFF